VTIEAKLIISGINIFSLNGVLLGKTAM